MNYLRTLLLLLGLVLALALGACGSEGSSAGTTTGAEAASGGIKPPADFRPDGERGQGKAPAENGSKHSSQDAIQPTSEPAPAFEPRNHHDSGGGSEQFKAKGGDNSIEEYGSEASGAEFDEAARTFHNYLDARSVGAWGAACERLASVVTDELIRQLGSPEGGKKPTCATILAGLSAGAPRSALRAEAAQADVSALRVDGDRAFLLFRGLEGEAFFIPMLREDGHWKVAAISSSALL